jgi:hypothetical protein
MHKKKCAEHGLEKIGQAICVKQCGGKREAKKVAEKRVQTVTGKDNKHAAVLNTLKNYLRIVKRKCS